MPKIDTNPKRLLRHIARLARVVVVSVAVLMVTSASTANAYKCDPADVTGSDVFAYTEGDGGVASELGRSGLSPVQLQYIKDHPESVTYNGGGCQVTMPDTGDNTDGNAITDGTGKIISCDGSSTQASDGHCYSVKDLQLGGVKPRLDDGTQLTDDQYKKNFGCSGPNLTGTTCQDGTACLGSVLSYIPGLEDTANGGCVGGYDTTHPKEIVPDPTAKAPANAVTCTGGATPVNGQCPPGSTPTSTSGVQPDNPAAKETFGDCGTHGTSDKPVETVLIGCDAGVCKTASSGWTNAFKGAPVIACLIKFAVSALTVLVGVGSVAGIAWEAFKYSKAQDDQGAVSEARKRIRDIVIGLIIYIFMGAAINWIVPGGVIGG